MFTIDNGSDGGVSTPQKLICRSPLMPCFSLSFLLPPASSKLEKEMPNITHLNSGTLKQGSLTLYLLQSPVCLKFWLKQCFSNITVHSHHLWIAFSYSFGSGDLGFVSTLVATPWTALETKAVEHYGCLCPALLCTSCETLSKLHSLQSWFSICKRESLLLDIWNYCKGKLNSHKSS